MASEHEHKHGGCCKHENVKYCQKCGVPYCEDCGHEWAEKCTLNHGWPYYWTYPICTDPFYTPVIEQPYSVNVPSVWEEGTHSIRATTRVGCWHD
ncbi:hypothetical protein LCGC14_1876810 [marine sediment metagenome]|uniref:Uncharacterized protein n=1 Tax=marine sediment metagenome TaxID=412755 RepID=A0A0F9G3G2_9ZZZZ